MTIELTVMIAKKVKDGLKELAKALKNIKPLLEKLYASNSITKSQYSRARDHTFSLGYILAKGLPQPDSISEEDIEAGLLNIFNGKCPCSTILPHLMLEEILYLIGNTKLVTHLHIEYQDYVMRWFSSELHRLTELSSTSLEQVRITFKVSREEMRNGEWKDNLPNVPYISYSYSELTEELLMPVEACIDLKNRLTYLDKYDKFNVLGNESMELVPLKMWIKLLQVGLTHGRLGHEVMLSI